MKTLMTLIVLLCLPLQACGTLTPQQRQAAVQVLNDELAAGNITQAQHAAAIEAIQKDEPYDWTGLGFAALNALLALVGAPMIVRKVRGPPTQKVGLPASKVKSGA